MSVYGSQTVALTDEGDQQQNLHAFENNWVRRISRTKGVDRRRMNDPGEGIGMRGSFTGKMGERRDDVGRAVDKNGC